MLPLRHAGAIQPQEELLRGNDKIEVLTVLQRSKDAQWRDSFSGSADTLYLLFHITIELHIAICQRLNRLSLYRECNDMLLLLNITNHDIGAGIGGILSLGHQDKCN